MECNYAILLLSILLPGLWPNFLPSSQNTSSSPTENINIKIPFKKKKSNSIESGISFNTHATTPVAIVKMFDQSGGELWVFVEHLCVLERRSRI